MHFQFLGFEILCIICICHIYILGGHVKSLLELCSQSVALHIPFEQVEKMHLPVPEEVQLKIAFWSFPSNEEDIR